MSREDWIWALFIFSALGYLKLLTTEEIYSVCCDSVEGNCQRACKEITLIDLATKPERHKLFTAHLEQHCAGLTDLPDFMRCFNNTTRELQRGTSWPGRTCCALAKDPRCQVACVYAQSVHELEHICFGGKETTLFHCIRARKDAERCCGHGIHRSGNTSACRAVCKGMFSSSIKKTNLTYVDLILLHEKCSDSFEVVHCAWGLGNLPEEPIKCGRCASLSTTSTTCKIACQEIANKKLAGVSAVELLISSGCGPPDPADSFWTCLRSGLAQVHQPQSSIAHKFTPNPDSTKLYCCSRAHTSECKTACFQTYDPGIENILSEDVLWDCLEDPAENELQSCLNDVSRPCRIGCSNLHFCHHYNNFPDQSFRSCDVARDYRAQRKYKTWKASGRVALTEGLTVEFKESCTDMWISSLCYQQIQPCLAANWNAPPCRNDCVLHFGRCYSKNTSVQICNHFFPETPTKLEQKNISSCTPIEFDGHSAQATVTLPAEFSATPCQPNPCPKKIACVVRRLTEKYSNDGYECLPGCTISRDSSEILDVVGHGSYLVVPQQATNFGPTKSATACYKVCLCNANGMLSNCVESGICDGREGCSFNGVFHEHGSRFNLLCSRCVCMDGELICSAGHCLSEFRRDEERNALTGLPCSCPLEFSRVCGLNGKTYPTECAARCSGLNEYNFQGGICSLQASCPLADCGPDRWCVERAEVCLSQHRKCQQHTCVDLKKSCNDQPTEIVCDSEGNEHSNLCSLLLAGKQFQYVGKCLQGCSDSGVVCGQNSETFASECAALADRVAIDYQGRCITVGGRIEKGLINTCLVVEKQCPQLETSGCVRVIPPDACCAVCAGALRVLFSKRRLHRLAELQIITITSRALITELQNLVPTTFCQVLGYLTMENDIVVLVQRINYTGPNFDRHLEHVVCVREAERLHYLINSQNPLIIMNARLWPLAASEIIHIAVGKNDAASVVMTCKAQVFLVCSISYGIGRLF